MLAELAGEVAEFFLRSVGELVCYCIGWFLVTGLTFGRLRCQDLATGSMWSRRWFILGKDKRGRFLTVGATTLIGLLSLFGVLVSAAYFA